MARGVPLASAMLLVVCLQAAPAAQAAPGIQNPDGAAPVTLFFHVADFQDFPVNTQEPGANHTTTGTTGLTTWSTSCLPTTPAGTGQAFHTRYGFSSPGFVEYDFVENGRPRYHPERDLSDDVRFADGGLALHWYVETSPGFPEIGGQDLDGAPLVLPQVTVRATLRTGEHISVDEGGYDDGDLLGQGESEPVFLAGPATAQLSPAANWTMVGNRNVYGIVVPVALVQDVVPKSAGFSLRVDTYLSLPGACNRPDDGYAMASSVAVHSSPGHRPRMEAQIVRPIRLEYLHPQVVGDVLYLHTSSNSPWGNYDVSVARTTVEVQPDGAPSLQLAAAVQRTHEHGSHTQPVDVTYAWPYARDGARSGQAYTVVVTVENLQGTAQARGEATFTLGDRPQVTRCGGLTPVEEQAAAGQCTTEFQDAQGNPLSETQPGPAWPVVGVALALLAAARLRRRPS